MTQERRLGRGLQALLGRPMEAMKAPSEPSAPTLAPDDAEAAQEGLCRISIFSVDNNPYQPRAEFDETEISALAESIQTHGVLQPIVVRKAGDRYQLIAGERRLRAAIKAGMETVPAILNQADDRQMAEIAIVENMQRKDLNPLEKASAFQSYLQTYQCTQDELAKRLSLDRSTVCNLLRLLELPEAVQEMLRDAKLTQGHARALLPLGDEDEQLAFARRICDERLSVRATEAAVSEAIRAADAEPLADVGSDEDTSKTVKFDPTANNLASLERDLRMVLGAKVDLHQNRAGKGRMVIHFSSSEEFERLAELLKATSGGAKSAAA
ncbi:MAG: ParB/RepB/Spo0J family partition protein [Pirellulales bacterium]|nr:ParB/RepB/Spo0J family partition protein [Pirellulales bacterium]